VHIPDIFFVKPVYLDDSEEVAAYTVIVSHMTDMGGRFPGSMSPSAASIWEEGIIIPLVPLVKAGVLNQALLDTILANSRDPVAVRGDIRSALGALETGAVQYADFVRRVGRRELTEQCGLLLYATERATRAAILRDIPDGRVSATDYLDGPIIDGVPPKIVCTIEKSGDRIRFDFAGTSPQAPGGINCNISDIFSVCAFATRSVFGEDIDVNDGFYRCLEFHAPEGSLINASFPAGVSVRGTTVVRVNDVTMAAMAQLVPRRLPAMVGGGCVLILSGRHADGREWVFLDYVGAGWGGRPNGDGVPALTHPLVNSSNIPAEVIEQKYPTN
jgi:N-methylhydantoinase B